MYPKQHLFFGALFSLILLFFFPQIGFLGFITIILSTFLIDADHYIYYVFKKDNLNIKKAYFWFIKRTKKRKKLSKKERRKYKEDILIFHGIEFLVLLIFLLFLNRIFLFVFIGVLFHFFLDFVDAIYNKKVFYFRFSQVYNYITNEDKVELV